MTLSFLEALLALSIAFVTPASADGQRDQHWIEDLDHLATEFSARHKNAFSVVSKEDFMSRVQQVRAAIPSLTDEEIAVEFMSIVALAHDSHSAIRPPLLFSWDRLPIQMRWYQDDLRVISATAELKSLIGSKVVSVEGFSLEEVGERFREIECFGNDSWMKERMPDFLVHPRLLFGAALSEDPQDVLFEFESDEGERNKQLLSAAAGNSMQLIPQVRRQLTARGARWHWFEYVPDSQLLYVQYNRCLTTEEHNIVTFTEELLNAVKNNPVRGVVFDVQYNSGGSSILGTMLFSRMYATLTPTARKNIYCIIGRRTFSSAILNALELRDNYGATLVGEATGGSPNHFGEVRSFSLPNSSMNVQYSTKYFHKVKGAGNTIEPDVVVTLSYADAVGDQDILWDKILQLAK